eukprot:352590-Chlamydomonas_euryale.AAC.3
MVPLSPCGWTEFATGLERALVMHPRTPLPRRPSVHSPLHTPPHPSTPLHTHPFSYPFTCPSKFTSISHGLTHD